MYLSRITLHTGQLSPAQLLHLVDRGEYVMHQWLWDLFPGGKERQFLYRREELQGAFRFFVLSQERPAESETFTIECRPFVSELRTGQSLCFNLRANPTICKAGKRHDLLMEAKRQVRGQAEGSDVWLHQQQAALDWLAFRFPQHDWLEGRPALAALRERLMVRPSFAETVPRA